MEPVEPPVRAQVIGHECVCTIVNVTGNVRDACRATVMNPDQPFCDYCEAVGHADLAQQTGGRL